MEGGRIEGFKANVIARRGTLKTLFDAALTSLNFVQAQSEGSEALTIAQWTAQDCGNALMLIVDYALLRFLVDIGKAPAKSRQKLHAEMTPRFLDRLGA